MLVPDMARTSRRQVTSAADGSQPPVRQEDPTLDEVVRRIVTTLRPERVYLFGSRARGEVGPDSDYDLLVVVTEAREPTHHLSQQAHAALWGMGVSADILVWTRRGFEERLGVVASLPALVMREGRLLYAA